MHHNLTKAETTLQPPCLPHPSHWPASQALPPDTPPQLFSTFLDPKAPSVTFLNLATLYANVGRGGLFFFVCKRDMPSPAYGPMQKVPLTHGKVQGQRWHTVLSTGFTLPEWALTEATSSSLSAAPPIRSGCSGASPPITAASQSGLAQRLPQQRCSGAGHYP